VSPILIQGCGDGLTGGNVTFAPASGTVKMNGSPLNGARVMAYPEKGPVAIAVTDAEGKFALKSGAEDGVAVGKVEVSVSVPTETASPAAGPKIDPSDPTSLTRAMQAASEQSRPSSARESAATVSPDANSLIPAKYSNPKTSGLSFEIKQGQDNVLTIDLK
jgi:hypothetical protein